MTAPGVLVFSPRFNETARALAAAATLRGLRTETLSDWRVPEHLRGHGEAHLYAGPLYADAIGDALNLALLEPPADWLPSLPRQFTGRDIIATTIAEARRLRRPTFVKPPNDKSFPARVYPDGSRLPGPDAVDDDMQVLVSDVVTFSREFRLFVLDGKVHTGSQYLRDGDLVLEPLAGHADELTVHAFADALLADYGHTLPSAVVVDVGFIRSPGGDADADGTSTGNRTSTSTRTTNVPATPATEIPAVIEANMAWASGHYACDAEHALDVVLRAAFDRGRLTARDAPFARPVGGVEE